MRDGFQTEHTARENSEMEQSVAEIARPVPCRDATDKTE